MPSNPLNHNSFYYTPYKRTAKDHVKMIVILAVWAFICHLVAFNTNVDGARFIAQITSLVPIAVYLINVFEELPLNKLNDQQVVALMSSKDQVLTNTMKTILKEYGYVPRHHLKYIKRRIEERDTEISRLIVEKKMNDLNDSELLNLNDVLYNSIFIIDTILEKNSK